MRVPNLSGKDVAQAAAALTTTKLRLGARHAVPSDAGPKGAVIAQSPAPGTEVGMNNQVNLTVSTGTGGGDDRLPNTRVPNLLDQSVPEASSALKEAGLELGTKNKTRSDTRPKGRITGQDPPAGTEVSRGSAVNIVASTGSLPRVFLILGGIAAAVLVVAVGAFLYWWPPSTATDPDRKTCGDFRCFAANRAGSGVRPLLPAAALAAFVGATSRPATSGNPGPIGPRGSRTCRARPRRAASKTSRRRAPWPGSSTGSVGARGG